MTTTPKLSQSDPNMKRPEKETENIKGIISDLMSEKRMIQRLLDSLAKASIGIGIVSLDHRILFQNKILRDRFGDSQDQLCYEKYMGFKKPCDFCPLTMAVSKNRVESVELTGQDGKEYEILIIPLQSKDGTIDSVLEIVKDITETKKTDAALRDSEQNFRNLFNASGDGILVAEIATMKFIEANPAICRILDYSREELLTLSVYDIHPPESLDHVIGEFLDQANGKKLVAQGIPCLTKKGNVIYADISATKAMVMGKECSVGLFRDITEKMKMEQQLLHTQKMEAIGTLAGGIAHDFNNILSIITGNASYAMDFFKDNLDIVDCLTEILKGAKQAQNLTHQFLTFAKGGAPIKKCLELNSLVRESAEFVTRGASSSCLFQLEDGLWCVEADAGQIHQALSNLVINAVQAMPEGGTIRVQTENTEVTEPNVYCLKEGPYVRITVEDQGMGIPEKHIANIFDPYFSTKQRDSGLGLSTVYSIIRRHNGHISVQSSPGKGAMFHIYLPATEKGLTKGEEREKIVHKGQGRILVMDDQKSLLEVAQRLLSSMGYDTVFAKDGQEAIEIYRKAYEKGNSFDVVILDLTVPNGLGGAKTIPQLLKINPNVKTVVSSGYSNDPIMANYRDYGFAAVIPKPYTKDQLAEVLNEILRPQLL